ncbi:MAG: 2-oxoacid ferredoxin oxidoreductase, partial [Thermoplasmataceae archaeon]
TYNKNNSYDYFRKRVYKLENNDKTDLLGAYKLAQELGDKIPIGVLYQKEEKTYEDYDPIIANTSLVEREPVKVTEEFLEEFL